MRLKKYMRVVLIRNFSTSTSLKITLKKDFMPSFLHTVINSSVYVSTTMCLYFLVKLLSSLVISPLFLYFSSVYATQTTISPLLA